MIITTLLTFSLQLALAEQTAESKSAPAASPTAAAALKDEEGGGEALVEEASLSPRGRYRHGYSWRNTQAILMGGGLVACRLGGMDARSSAVPALLSAGYCDVTNKKKAKDPKKMPVGTVWVYDHLPHGNTIVKTSNGKFYDNGPHDNLPVPRGGEKVTILEPNCGPKSKKCGDFKMQKTVDAKETHQAPTDDMMHPSQKRLEAEESCGYANAFRATDAFNECVEEKLTQ